MTTNSAERAFRIKKFLEDYGEQKGYDRTSFYQQMLKKFRALEDNTTFLKSNIGVQRSGGTWVGYKNKLKPWLDSTVKPGPNFGIKPVPDDLTGDEFLARAEGLYHLKAVLKKLNPEIVTYWKVTGAVKRAKDPSTEIGVTLRNGVYVVDMHVFRKWYEMHEP
jgi:hypothetical protein